VGNSTCYEIVVCPLSFSERHFTAFDQRHFTPDRHFAFEGVAWYWHFVDVVWLALFVSVYWL
jgi:heme/copper-type cytochrome/quinol oxidase subunit 3